MTLLLVGSFVAFLVRFLFFPRRRDGRPAPVFLSLRMLSFGRVIPVDDDGDTAFQQWDTSTFSRYFSRNCSGSEDDTRTPAGVKIIFDVLKNVTSAVLYSVIDKYFSSIIY